MQITHSITSVYLQLASGGFDESNLSGIVSHERKEAICLYERK